MTNYHKVLKLKTGDVLVCRCMIQRNEDLMRRETVEIYNPVVIQSYQMEIDEKLTNGFMFKHWIEMTNDTSYIINVDSLITASNLNHTIIEKYEIFVKNHPQEKINFASPSSPEEEEKEELSIFRHLIGGNNTIN